MLMKLELLVKMQKLEYTPYPKQKKWTFKILPNGANFILGSDSALSRGEVITF